MTMTTTRMMIMVVAATRTSKSESEAGRRPRVTAGYATAPALVQRLTSTTC